MPGLRPGPGSAWDLEGYPGGGCSYKDGVLTAKEGYAWGAGKEKTEIMQQERSRGPEAGRIPNLQEKTASGLETAFPGCLIPSIWMGVALEGPGAGAKGPWSGLFSLNPMNFSQRERLVPWQNTPGAGTQRQPGTGYCEGSCV